MCASPRTTALLKKLGNGICLATPTCLPSRARGTLNLPGRSLCQITFTDVLLLGRFVVGAAVAISAVADVSYLAEVAPRSIRGAMVSANELAISLGVMGAFLAGHLLQHVDGEDP